MGALGCDVELEGFTGKRGEEAAVGGWQLIEMTKEDGVDAAKRAHSASFIFGPFTTLLVLPLATFAAR